MRTANPERREVVLSRSGLSALRESLPEESVFIDPETGYLWLRDEEGRQLFLRSWADKPMKGLKQAEE